MLTPGQVSKLVRASSFKLTDALPDSGLLQHFIRGVSALRGRNAECSIIQRTMPDSMLAVTNERTTVPS